MTEPGQIPQSEALAEAGSGAESLRDLFSRDPEGYQRQDLDRIIQAMREHRQRLALAEAAGKKPSRELAPKVGDPGHESSAQAEDLGL